MNDVHSKYLKLVIIAQSLSLCNLFAEFWMHSTFAVFCLGFPLKFRKLDIVCFLSDNQD